MKSILPLLLSFALLTQNLIPALPAKVPISYEENETGTETATQDSLALTAPSAILMEASTGTIIYEKDANTVLHPASITKIMTMILIFDALAAGNIHLDDTVTVSEHAAEMGGSQVFLEPGETQTVDTMLKCISIASANDACVAMAELIAGSESEFVSRMNERAKGLGMNNTNFVNCCGLDVDNHMTTAHDVALMSKELITKYPQIHNYCTVWMDTIIHQTKRGSSEFGLTNTNKLIRQYEYATGLKTGSTGLAKFCVSATAKKDDIELIAVIMACPDSKARFADATSLLNYGFSKCQVYSDTKTNDLTPLTVKKGTSDSVSLKYETNFRYVDTAGNDLSSIKKEIELPKEVTAPIKANEIAGKAIYTLNGTKIGSVSILYETSIPKAKFSDYFIKVLGAYL
ncbi:MAG: D-alanyl-D-alanine carboxypeptidase family protein [Lachnospiraceae bacterium]|nr:D-alanyl-D-alanine carboxypeptidase family protein [Lachnospiraceae bacterium]